MIQKKPDVRNFPARTLSFLSLVVWISLVNFKQGISSVKMGVFPGFPGFQGVRQGGKILGKFRGFP